MIFFLVAKQETLDDFDEYVSTYSLKFAQNDFRARAVHPE